MRYEVVALASNRSRGPPRKLEAGQVTVNGDDAVAPDETFALQLAQPTRATIADGQAAGTIRNDDQ